MTPGNISGSYEQYLKWELANPSNLMGNLTSQEATIFCTVNSENLTGKLKILLALSNFLKGNIDISLFVRAYHQILLEESVKDNSPWEYTEEKLKLSGLL